MKAHVINAFGNVDVFQESNLLKMPIPSDHEIQIQVLGSSVNDLDTKIRSGNLGFIAPEFPAVLHGDIVGVVTQVGSSITKFKKGDKVFGFVGGIKGYPGALAEVIVAKEDFFAQAPGSISNAELGSLPLVGITAYEAVVEKAHVQKNQQVLVYGAAGGVGHLAIQLAKIREAKVVAVVVNDEQAQLALSLGADHAIVSGTKDVKQYVQEFTNGFGFDVVIDTVGLQNFPIALEAVKAAGTLVNTFAYIQTDLSPAQMKGVSLHFIAMLIPLFTNTHHEKYGQILATYANWLEAKKIKVVVDEKTFRFHEVGKAHAYYESRQAKGKVALLN